MLATLLPASPPSPPEAVPPSVPSSPPSPSITLLSPPPSPLNISNSTLSTPPPSYSLPTPMIVGLSISGGVVLLVVLGLMCFFCWLKKRSGPSKDDPYGGQSQNFQNHAPPPAEYVVKISPHLSEPPHTPSHPPAAPPALPAILPPPSPGMRPGSSTRSFTYEELAMATDQFSDVNILGQGGFGYVHRGMLTNGKEVAVKQLKVGSGQGEREFEAEVDIISRVHHRNVVSLVGYCISGTKRLLVYEFVPNKTLEHHLHGEGRPTVDWPTRIKVALGSAKGLAYLHEDCHPKIIHRDIKATNILLDLNLEAKVADFGLAKTLPDADTHVSTRVMGTFGYLAPEYATSGKLTDKSDVFSFGVMLLELITGRHPVDSNQSYDSLVDWARPLLKRALDDGNYNDVIDSQLGNNYNPNEMARMISCAAACVRKTAGKRPRMSQIVRVLEGDVSVEDLNEGVRPGHSSAYGSYGSATGYDSGQHNEDMKEFRKMARGSQDCASSEYSAPTSEYNASHV